MVGVAGLFRAVADGRLAPEEAWQRQPLCYPGATFSNGFLHDRPGHQLSHDVSAERRTA